MSTTTTATNSLVSIPLDAPAGGISFTLPVTTAISYYKIAPSYTVTFGWNMTNVLVTPTALTFSAYCSSNKNTYPIGQGTIAATETTLLWEPYVYQTGQGAQTPLVQGTYTLEVMDEQGTTAIGKAGRFNYNNQLTFALYTPQSYTPLSEWTCAACRSSAVLSIRPGHPAVIGLLVTFVVMLISGWGVLRSMVHHGRQQS